mgnify:FL=1
MGSERIFDMWSVDWKKGLELFKVPFTVWEEYDKIEII